MKRIKSVAAILMTGVMLLNSEKRAFRNSLSSVKNALSKSDIL